MEKIDLVDDVVSLRNKSTPLDLSDVDKLKEISNVLIEYLNKTPEAFGISGVQLGINKTIFAIRFKDNIKVFINPVLVFPVKKQTFISFEGCMSFPKIVCPIPRFNMVEVIYYKINHKNQVKQDQIKAKDIFNGQERISPYASAIQHEFDHLEGITVLDKAIPLDLKEKDDKMIRIYRSVNKATDFYKEDDDKYIFSNLPVVKSENDIVIGFIQK